MKKYGKLLWIILIVSISANVYAGLNGTMNGTLQPNASFLGTHYKERVGYVIDSAGDVNGDNYDDIIIGTFHNHTKGWDAGAVYLILGRQVADWGMQDSLTHSDVRFLASQRLEAVGFAIAGKGDVNGDGLSDILIGAPAGNDAVGSRPGKMYVVFGDSTAPWGYDCILDDRADLIFHGENPQDLAGRALEIIGDLNNDGCDEILCAAPYNDDAGTDAGKVYLIMGRKDGWMNGFKLPLVSIASFVFPKAYATCGYSVAHVGDVNNDGLPDFAIGAPGANRAFIIYGRSRANWGDNFNLNNADLIIEGEHRLRDTELGWSVEGAGDVNGDGIDDIIISAIEDNSGGYHSGKVFLVLGRSGGWPEKELSLSQADASYIGEGTGDQAGWGIAGIGDVNRDGYDDFMIGAWKAFCDYPEAGKAYLIYGKSNGWEQNIDLEEVTEYFSGIADTNFAGYAVSTAGDMDNDGWPDFFLSAPYNDGTSTWSGQIYLFASQKLEFNLSGNVNYHQSEVPIQMAQLIAVGAETENDTLTNELGDFAFDLPWKNDYTITPFKTPGEDMGDNCITAYDAVLTARHSVKLDTLNFPMRNAADVNKDGRITIYDASLILRHSLGYPETDDSHIGEWLFEPNMIIVPQFDSDLNEQNFEAIIRGDVNGDWASTRHLIEKDVIFAFNAHEENDQLILPINLNSENQILSYELFLEYNDAMLEFQRVEASENGKKFRLDYFNENGKLNIGAFSMNNVKSAGIVANIIFKIKEDDYGVSDISISKFRINDHQFTASVLSPSISNKIRSFQLFQNFPNPFNGVTDISYQIERPGEIKFRIFNTLGQQVYEYSEYKEHAGHYKFSWDSRNSKGDFVTTGLYMCQATWGNIKTHIKMLYIK